MAVPAGEVQSDLRKRVLPILGELTNLTGIDTHHVCSYITGKFRLVPDSTLRYPRHVAVDTGHIHCNVYRRILELLLLPMTVLTGGARRLLFCLAKLHDTHVRIVAQHAVDRHMLALEQLFILFMMPDKPATRIDGLHSTAAVACSTLFRVAINEHPDSPRILCMQASRTMTCFTSNTWLGPGSHNTRKTVLMCTLGLVCVSCGVTGTAVVWPFFSRMIRYPSHVCAHNGVCKIVLPKKLLVTFGTRYDVPILSDKPGLPVVATDYVRYIIYYKSYNITFILYCSHSIKIGPFVKKYSHVFK